MDTVTEQLTDSSEREFVINGILPETDYTVQVRGYYELLGSAGTTTVRLEGMIILIVYCKLYVVVDLGNSKFSMIMLLKDYVLFVNSVNYNHFSTAA